MGYQAQRIFIHKKQAVRIITLSKYDAHAAPIYKELKLLKVSDIYKLQELKFYHKLINKQLPEYSYNIPYTNTFEIQKKVAYLCQEIIMFLQTNVLYTA